MTAAAHAPELHHAGIAVHSLDRFLAFYRDLLGFEEVYRVRSEADYLSALLGYRDLELHVAMVRPPASSVCLELLEYRSVDLAEIDHGHGNPGIVHLAFRVDDVDGIHARLDAAGVGSVSAPVTPTAGPNRGGRLVYMVDPDGVRVELMQAPGTAPADPINPTTGEA